MEIFVVPYRFSHRFCCRRDPCRRHPQQARCRPGRGHGRLAAARLRGAGGPPVDMSAVRGFALDEYVGLPAGHPQSYAEVVRREVTERLRLDPANVAVPGRRRRGSRSVRLPTTTPPSPRRGGIDVQILGIGHNGHLAFNEPGSALDSRTRVEVLTERTREANARYFSSPDDVPLRCITQGLGTILEARHLLLVVNGADKAEILAAPSPVR